MTSPNPGKAKAARLKSLAERRAEYRLAARRGQPLAPPPKDVSHAILKALRPILKQTGSPISAVEARWAEIVGPALAKLSQPVKVVRSRKGAVLVVRARSAAAAKLQHISDIVVERVNLGSGKKITGLRIDHTQSTPPRGAASAPSSDTRNLSPQQRRNLVDGLKDVESPQVKSALAALGEAMQTHKRS